MNEMTKDMVEFFGGPLDGAVKHLKPETLDYQIPLPAPMPLLVEMQPESGEVSTEVMVSKLRCQRYQRTTYYRGEDTPEKRFQAMKYMGEEDLVT